MRIHYDFKPDENKYPTRENISIGFPLTSIEIFFYVRNKLSFPCSLSLSLSRLLLNMKELSV